MSFDFLAPAYSLLERIGAGGKMQRARLALLGSIAPPRRILLAGEGHGRFLSACLEHFPHAEITVLDASAGMLAQAKRALEKDGAASTGQPVHFLQTDILGWQPPLAHWDLVVTNFFLDCFLPAQIGQIVGTLSEAATHQSQWLVTDFSTAGKGLAGWRARAIVWGLYAFFRLFTRIPGRTLVNADPWLQQAGFSLEKQQLMDYGLLKSQLWIRGGKKKL